MMPAIRALVAGLWAVVRAPLLLAAVAIVTLLAAAPFAVFVNNSVQASLAARPQVSLPSTEIDPEWWMEFRAHADGLAATFTPTIIGFAAPLDNLSSVLDGTRRPLALAMPVALAGLLWVFLWGGLLDRFSRPGRTRVRAFVSAGMAHAPRLLLIAIAAAIVNLILYFTVHAALFGPVYEWLAGRAGSERDAFFWRLGLYVIFGALLDHRQRDCRLRARARRRGRRGFGARRDRREPAIREAARGHGVHLVPDDRRAVRGAADRVRRHRNDRPFAGRRMARRGRRPGLHPGPAGHQADLRRLGSAAVPGASATDATDSDAASDGISDADSVFRRFRRFTQIRRGPADAGRITRRPAMKQEDREIRESRLTTDGLSRFSDPLLHELAAPAAPRARANAWARLQNFLV